MGTSYKSIELPLSLYLLVNDQDNPNPDVSTHRSEAGGLRSFIFQRMVDIWSQAAIQLEVESIQYLEVPVDVLQGFGRAASVQEIEPFMDVDAIQPGLHFVEVVQEAVSACDALIAVIGQEWLQVSDAIGGRRLDNPSDMVSPEIATVLERGIPVLVRGVQMPREADTISRNAASTPGP